jgi:predicted NBD/HSP70 family sugar kinase
MSPHLILAADVGGTRMRAALVDADGVVVVRETAPTPADSDLPDALMDLIARTGASAAPSEVTHAVVGLPGAIDYAAGRLLSAPNLPDGWPDSLSAGQLSGHLGLHVHVANDADLAAVGEAAFGAGAGIDDVVAFLTVSTGIGAGVVDRGRLVHGHHSFGEFGHSVVDWRAWREGLPGTLEELASGSGLARQAREIGLGSLDAQAVLEAAINNDVGARAIWEDAVAACAAGVCNLVMAFAPHTVIVGGGIGRRPEFFDPLRQVVLQRKEHRPTELSMVVSALGDDAGLAGAAAWVQATERHV